MKHILLIALGCLVSISSFAQQPYKYLFIDDQWIGSSYSLSRMVHQPIKQTENPLIKPDKPWETGGVNCFGTVLHDNGKFRMWYQVYNAAGTKDGRYKYTVGYAESKDGIKWEKPNLGIFEYNGSKDNNIVLLSYGASDLYSPAVVKDDTEKDPSKRYKMLYWDCMSEENIKKYGSPFPKGKSIPGWTALDGEGFFVAFSPDGINWTKHGTQPVFTCACDASALMKNADNSYTALYKIAVQDDRHYRVLGASTSIDFIKWSEPKVILEPDWKDPDGTEFYGVSGFNYFGNKLGLIWMYRNTPSDKGLDVQLASVNQQNQWERGGDRKVFLPMGEMGKWDAGVVVPSSTPVISPPGYENEVFIYYGGNRVKHDDHRFSEYSIGLARMRLDGFASMTSEYFKGNFETKAISPSAKNMFINLDGLHGYVQIEAIDPSTKKVMGKSETISNQNQIRQPVKWMDGYTIQPGNSLQFRFNMQKSSLFSFWFE